MGYSAIVGSFNLDVSKAAGQDQSVTGVGFTPKIVLFWWSGSPGTGDTVAGGNISPGFGAAVSNASRFYVVGFSLDAAADSDTSFAHRNDAAIAIYSAAGTVDGLADFKSMDADGFTLTIDNQFTIAGRVSYLALGGDDLTNVFIGSKQRDADTGNCAVTGVGFRPDAVLFAMTPSNSAIGAAANLYFSLGMATGASNQGVVAADSWDAQATSIAKGYGYNGEVIASLYSNNAVLCRDTFVQFDADGFTLNQLEGTTRYYYYYVALKGGQYSVGDILTRTDGNDIAENVGFQPTALLFASANRALSTQDAATNHNRISIGAATSTSNRACAAWSDEHNLADTEAAYSNSDIAVYQNIIDDAESGAMDIKSIDASGFTAVMDNPDASACWVTYLAIGVKAATVYPQAAAGAQTSTGALGRAIAKAVGGAWSAIGTATNDWGNLYSQIVAGAMVNSGAVVRKTFISASGVLASSLANGAVCYWPMDEASGDRAELVNGYTLTDVGGVASAAGTVYGTAADFDMTVDQWLRRARADAAFINFGPGDAFTLAAWIYPTAFDSGPDAPNYYRNIYNLNSASYNSGGYHVMTSAGQLYVNLGVNSGVPTDNLGWHTGIFCALNQWQLVIFAYDDADGSCIARVNASEATTAWANHDHFAAATGGEFYIGAHGGIGKYVYDGRIGPAMIWSRVLTSAEMTEIYNSGAGWAYAPANLGGGLVRGTATSKAGAWSASGAITRGMGKALVGAWSSAGAIARAIAKGAMGAWSATGGMTRGIHKAMSGAWSGAGLRAIGRAFAGAWSGIGALVALLRKATPTYRTFTPPAEKRSYTPTAESRTFTPTRDDP